MSVEEYLAWEVTGPIQPEYVGGYAFFTRTLEDLTSAHSLIKGNLAAKLYGAAALHQARVLNGQFLLRIGQDFLCPDVMVLPLNAPQHEQYGVSPSLLAEVLSPSSAQNDRVGKYAMYTSIPTLRTYLIAEQNERRVYLYQREGDDWRPQELVEEGEIHIPCLGLSLNLDELYEDVTV